ncbi:MAG: thioredoxin domain-containing protein [Nocardioidaceae bacterium]
MATKKERKAASERVRAMQAQQAAAERRRRTLIVGAVVVAVIAAVVGVGIAVQSGRQGPTSGKAPAGVTSDGGVLRGGKTAPVQVVVYEDFQCPSCKAFEENVGSTLATDVSNGQIQLEYRPVAFLDRASTTNYSSRALGTAACALDDGGPTVFTKLHDLLFTHQPAEGSAGLTDGQLADLAAEAGANKQAVASCQSAGTYDGWVAMVTDDASKAGITGTPTYFVDGKQVSFSNTEDPKITLTKLIDAAAAQQ